MNLKSNACHLVEKLQFFNIWVLSLCYVVNFSMTEALQMNCFGFATLMWHDLFLPGIWRTQILKCAYTAEEMGEMKQANQTYPQIIQSHLS